MSDWQGVAYGQPIISTADPRAGGLPADVGQAAAGGNAVWPAANRAIFIPFEIQAPTTAYQIAFVVAVQSGLMDVGIYDEIGNRLVNAGSTSVPAAGAQVINITDTALVTGTYFLAMNCDNTTASFLRVSAISNQHMWASGAGQQAVGAVTLPDPFTWASPASAYYPVMWVSTFLATI